MPGTRLHSLLLLTSVLLLLPASLRGQAPAEPILLAVRLDGRIERVLLDEVISCYEVGDRVFVPLGELTRLLDIEIRVDPLRRVAEGFILREERDFRLDVSEATVEIDGVRLAFSPGDIDVRDDDLYVEAGLLGRWLPLDLAVDRQDMVLNVRPRELLPRELRRLREMDVSRSLLADGSQASTYPELRVPYAFWDGPFADFGLQLLSARGPYGERQIQTAYSADVSSDILYMESRLFVAGTEDGISDGRFGMGRMDPEGRLLGFLGAREVLLGEALSPGLDLIALPGSGPGVLVSNFPLQQPIRFDEHTFQGDVPAGWDVELYRNEALVAYQQAGQDGRYRFDGVPLLFGANVFRLVFYGPHGERREETRQFNVGRSLTPQGRLYYRGVFNDPGRSEPRSTLELDFGIHRQLSLNLGASVIQEDDRQNRYARVGLRGFGGPAFVTADLAVEQDGGRALKVGLQTAIGSLGVSLQHTRLDRFESELFEPVFGPIHSRSLARLDGTFSPGGAVSMPIMLQWRRDGLETGQSVNFLINRVSTRYRGFSITNELQRTFAQGEGAPAVESATQGLLLLSRYTPTMAIRGEAAYTMEPVREMTGLTFTLERWLGNAYRGSLGLARQLREGETHVLLGANKLQGSYGFGFVADYSEREGLSGSLSLTIGLRRNPRTGGWAADAQPAARLGGLSARVFLDADADGIMDPGEKPLEGIGLSVGGVKRAERTGSDGTVFVGNLTTHESVDLAVSTDTLEDPLWMASREGVRLVPRPGKVVQLNFPIVGGGEVTGTVYRLDSGGETEAAGMRLELVDDQGAVVRETRTGPDGFYDIAAIAPGHYDLRIEPAQLARLGLVVPQPMAIRIGGENGTLFEGLDIRLLSNAGAEGAGAME